MVEIALLGPLEVRRDGNPVALNGDVARRLVGALATERPVTSDRLIDVVWGEDLPRSPKAALQTQISRLRSRLGEGIIVNRGGGYDLSDADLDLDRFAELTQTGDADDLHAAVRLVRGRPLEDLGDCVELDGTRRAIVEMVRSARLRLARAWVDSGRSEDAIPELERLVGDDPLFEPAWALLAAAHHTAGRQAEAIDVVDRYRRQVAERGLEPSAHMLEVEQNVFESPPVAPRPSSVQRTAIRSGRPALIGRQHELEAVRSLLRTVRWVNVVGPGGMGKTALAEAAASSLAGEFEGGAVEVALVEERDEADVASALARAFGVRWSEDPLEAVTTAIGTKPTLVLLDNCEHVSTSVAATVERLIAVTPHVTVLNTSREPLGSPHEHVFRITSLGQRAAVELYRARAIAAGAELHPEDDPAVGHLCAAVDGMPLAIEMAAARSGSMTPVELLEVLESDLTVLEARGMEPRHRSIDALVDWSYQLLGEDDRSVFRAIGVFAGPFECSDAAEVLGLPVVRTATLLGRLVDRSMLTSRRRRAVTVYQMLSTLRNAALRLLSAAGEGESLQTAHAGWAARFTMSAADFPDRPQHRDRLERIGEALPDVLAAHRWAAQHHDVGLQTQLIGPLFSYAYLVQPPGVAEAAEATLARLDRATTDVEGWLCAVAAAYRVAAGRPDDATEALGRAIDGEPASRVVPVWLMRGDVALYQGEFERAAQASRRATELYDPDAEPSAGVWTDGGVIAAVAAAYAGRIDEGIRLADEVLERAGRSGGTAYAALAEYVSGEVRQDVDPDRALEHLDRALDHSTASGISFVQGVARVTKASILARAGRHEAALREFTAVIDLLERTGARIHLWTALRNVVTLLSDLGEHEHVAFLLGGTEGRVSPTFGDEQMRLRRAELAARQALEDFDQVYAEGRESSVQDVAQSARSIIDGLSTRL